MPVSNKISQSCALVNCVNTRGNRSSIPVIDNCINNGVISKVAVVCLPGTDGTGVSLRSDLGAELANATAFYLTSPFGSKWFTPSGNVGLDEFIAYMRSFLQKLIDSGYTSIILYGQSNGCTSVYSLLYEIGLTHYNIKGAIVSAGFVNYTAAQMLNLPVGSILRDIPIEHIHGSLDTVVPYANVQTNTIDKLESTPNDDVTFTTVVGGGHTLSSLNTALSPETVASKVDDFIDCVLNPASNTVAPVASGFVITGQTLSTTDGTWINASTFTYQWQRAGVDISGATANTYIVTIDDEGNNITCNVTTKGVTVPSNSLSNFHIGDVTSSMWLDAFDDSTVTESSNSVSQWSDKSGNDNHVIQGTSSLQPSYVDGADPYIQLGSGRYFNFTNSISDAKDVIIILSDTNLNSNTPILGSSSTYDWHGGSNGPIFNATHVDADLKVNHYQNGTSIAWNSMAQRQDKTLLYFTSSSSGNGTRINNLSQDRDIPNRVADYRIRELIILPSIQDEATRQKIEGYEAHKWGLTSELPSDHPYKTTPA